MLHNTPAFSSFSVDDLDAAHQFYSEVLGLDVQTTPEGLSLKLAGGNTIFVYEKPNHIPATFTILNFSVPDIDLAVEELVARGVVFEHYDSDQIATDAKGIARGQAAGAGPDIAWFKDPAGNYLSVLEGKNE